MGNHPGVTGGPDAAMSPATEQEQTRAVRETLTSAPVGAIRRRLWAAFAFLAGEDWLTKQQLFEETPQAKITERCLS